MAEQIQIELVYAAPTIYRQTLQLDAGTTIQQAIECSDLLHQCPDIELGKNQVGIFGKRKKLDTPLEDGDRIEIYRPLKVEPMEARRRRVGKKASN